MSKNKKRSLQARKKTSANALPSKSPNTSSALVHRTFSGPLPEPTDFEKYELVLPGAADRILKMAENQSGHRQQIEDTTLKLNASLNKLGIFTGGVIALAAIAGGVYLGINGHPLMKFAIGLLLGLSGVFPIISRFFPGRNRRN